jgi:hypothetical protein
MVNRAIGPVDDGVLPREARIGMDGQFRPGPADMKRHRPHANRFARQHALRRFLKREIDFRERRLPHA